MAVSQPLTRNLVIRALAALVGFALGFGALLFVPAGTLQYWEAWVYLAIFLFPTTLVTVYFMRNDPGLLERRMRSREPEAEQRLIITLSWVYCLIAFALPGLDKRYEWSSVPAAMVIVADIVILLGYGLVFLVFKENRYASRVVEVEQRQEVISTGPYALVRHPMYLGAMLMLIFSPLALGSYWAIIASPVFPVILVARILNEEKILLRDLKGYREYMGRTRYRMIPGLW